MARSTMSENESGSFSIMVGPPSFIWRHEMGKHPPQTLSRSMQHAPTEFGLISRVWRSRGIPIPPDNAGKCLGLLPGQFHQRLEQSLQ